MPILLLPSGLPGALVPAEVLEVAAVGLVAFFMLGSRFLIHLHRNLSEGKRPMSHLDILQAFKRTNKKMQLILNDNFR